MDEDAQWHRIPDDALPGQFKIGTFVELEGRVMRVVSRSTSMISLRPIRWWERFLRFVKILRG